MGEIFDSGVNKVKISCITSDKLHGTWWAIGTKKEFVEIRTTKSGKIRVFDVVKKRHPYFTLEKPKVSAKPRS